MPARTSVSHLVGTLAQQVRPWLRPGRRDIVASVLCFLLGLLLHLSGAAMVSDTGGLALGWHLLILVAACSLQLLRHRSPVLALIGVAVLFGLDIVLGRSIGVIGALADLIYAATAYGSRRTSRLMVVIAAGLSTLTVATLLGLTGDWRVATDAALALLGLLIVPVWWAIHVRHHREIAASERRTAAQLARIVELDRRAAIADERARMARDLHDVVAGHLSAIAIQSEAALTMHSHDPVTTERVLRSVRENSVASLAEMRAMIEVLRDSDPNVTMEQTAPARLSQLDTLLESARASGLHVESHVDESVADGLPVAVDLAAYRITQEALTNAVKHVPASRVLVEMEHTDEQVVISVTNDLSDSAPEGTERDSLVPAGEPTEHSGMRGTGLVSMTERAQALGGTLTAGPTDTTPACWRVLATLPITSTKGFA